MGTENECIVCALTPEDCACGVRADSLAKTNDALRAENASLRSEVERLKGDEKYRHEQQYLLQKEVQAKHEQLTLALKERDAYREIALAGIETLNGGVLTKGLIEATDAQAQKLSSEGKK